MICWYCYWGWPKQVADIYNKYLNLTNTTAMHYGRGHIVWEDENFETENIQFCLDSNYDFSHATTLEQDEIIKQSLRELLLISEEIRCCEPENYDEENPENFPPPKEIEMIKI